MFSIPGQSWPTSGHHQVVYTGIKSDKYVVMKLTKLGAAPTEFGPSLAGVARIWPIGAWISA